MHYGVLVIVEPTDNITTAVEEALAPFGDGREWDWYQIGGRWTGTFNSDYKPETDPRNIERCDLCDGTGTRRDVDEVREGWCNGCTPDHERYGTPIGQSVKWPTGWAEHPGDIIPLFQVTEEVYTKNFYAVCVGGDWHAKQRFEHTPWAENPDDRYKFVEQELPPLNWLKEQYPEHRAVVVDCHN